MFNLFERLKSAHKTHSRFRPLRVSLAAHFGGLWHLPALESIRHEKPPAEAGGAGASAAYALAAARRIRLALNAGASISRTTAEMLLPCSAATRRSHVSSSHPSRTRLRTIGSRFAFIVSSFRVPARHPWRASPPFCPTASPEVKPCNLATIWPRF